MLQVVIHGVAATVLDPAKLVELDLCLIVGERGILGAPYSVPLLLDCVEQAKGVSGRLELIEVGLVFYLALDVLVAAPQDGGKHLT